LVVPFFLSLQKINTMKLLMLKSVVNGSQVHKKNTIVEVSAEIARQYIAVGIAVDHKQKEQKVVIETKEDKAPRKRRTKKK